MLNALYLAQRVPRSAACRSHSYNGLCQWTRLLASFDKSDKICVLLTYMCGILIANVLSLFVSPHST